MAGTVVVIGGSGFVGSHLCLHLLERGDRVIAYSPHPWRDELAWLVEPRKRELIHEQGGVENWPQLSAVVKKYRATQIVHAASPIDVAGLSSTPKVAFDIIAAGTINVLEAARLMQVQRVIFLSSVGVLPTVQYQPIDADHPTVMASEGTGSAAYSAGKLTGEAFCWAYRHAFDLDFVTVRLSAVYGFGSRNPIYIHPMVKGALRGERVRFESGREFPRDYVHVHDVAGIIAAALDSAPERLKHRVFYAGTGQPLVTAGQVAQMVRDMIPSADIEVAPGLSYSDRLQIRFRGVLDMRPVEEQLGCQIQYGELREGLRDLIRSYRRYMISRGETPKEVIEVGNAH